MKKKWILRDGGNMAIDYTPKKEKELQQFKKELATLKSRRKPFTSATSLGPKKNVIESMDMTKTIPSRNTGAHDTSKHTIMSKRYSETPEVRAEIEHKATLLAPVCNKGAYTVITSEEMAKTAGRKV